MTYRLPPRTYENQLFDMRNNLYEAQRAHDHAELRIEMMGTKGSLPWQCRRLPKHKSLCEEWHPDGRRVTRWLTDENESSDSVASSSRGRKRGWSAAHCFTQRHYEDLNLYNTESPTSHYNDTPEVCEGTPEVQ
jgi:hypothetical protein